MASLKLKPVGAKVDCIVHQSIIITKDLSNGAYDTQRISVMEGMTHNTTCTTHKLRSMFVCIKGEGLKNRFSNS